jgi:hypothetical protein
MNNIELSVVSDNQVSPAGTLKRRALYDRKRNYIASKPNVLYELLQRFPDLDWKYFELGCNPNMDLHMLPRDKYRDDEAFWSSVSVNPNIATIDFIEETMDSIPWNFEFFEMNPNITAEFILKYPDIFRRQSLADIAGQPNIMPEQLLKFLKERQTPNIGFLLSGNPNLTEELVMQYEKEYRLNTAVLAINTNLSLDFLSKRCDIKQLTSSLCERTDITLDFVLARNWFWHCDILSANPNINPEEFIEHWYCYHSDTRWANNPNLTFDFIAARLEDANMGWLSSNQFLWDDHVYKREIARDIAARQTRIIDALINSGIVCGSRRLSAKAHGLAGIIARYIDWM